MLKVDYRRKLEKFQNKLAGLTFLDPACGSGNFLTESYLSIRRLENQVISELNAGQQLLDTESTTIKSPIKVSISQFYGIEINDFAVTVAKTALWIAENQMMRETEEIIRKTLNFLPLKTNAYIHEGNALAMSWESVISPSKLMYCFGNPPFHGFTYMTPEQKKDMEVLFPGVKNLDFVCGWYKKASDYIRGTMIEVAFVSTNSIVQGETVSRFWQFMKDDIINFAYRSFIWDSEAKTKAHVHCVIIGFAKFSRKEKWIYDSSAKIMAKNINSYLVDGNNLLIQSRNTPLCNVPMMVYGNKPADGGNLIIEDEELPSFLKKDPNAKKFIRPLLGAAEYIKGKRRWCLWLVNASPAELRRCPLIMQRVQKCKEKRESSIAAGIRKFAITPTMFAQRTQPEGADYIIVPRVSSEKREYVPMGFIGSNTIATDAVQIIPNGTIYQFGVLVSKVHMAWMRAVAGRLKSDYRYSKDVVYNTFPWPIISDSQKEKIRKSAQEILDARKLYPESSLADLYDSTVMPQELRKAHKNNDKIVMQSYGFDLSMSEEEIVSRLMNLYQDLVNKEKK